MELQLLGARALRTESAVHPLRPLEAAFLGYLCDAPNRTLHRRTIGAALWPTSSPQNQLKSLSQLIYRLRSSIPGLDMNISKDTVGIQEVKTTEQYIRELLATDPFKALALFDAPYLPGFENLSDEVLRWREQRIMDVTSVMADVLERCFDTAAQRNDFTQIRVAATKLIETTSAPPSVFVIAHKACSYIGEAERANGFRREFEETYGDVINLPDDTWTDGADRLHIGNAPSITGDRVRFVGRTEELEALMIAWKRATDGNGQVVLITGEPGIGKTRLAEQALRKIALQGGRTWTSRCHSATRRLPYSAIAPLLAEASEDYSAHLTNDIPTIFASRRDVLNSSVAGTIHYLMAVPDREIKGKGLVIYVDDAQWADDLSTQVLALWAYKAPTRRVLLILTVRTEDIELPPQWISHELPINLRLELGQLSAEHAEQMVDEFERMSGTELPRRIRNAALWQSAGRPFLLLEALRDAVASPTDFDKPSSIHMPSSAEALLARRFKDLPEEVSWTSGLLAALDKPLPLHEVRMLTQLSDRVLVRTLALLQERGIVRYEKHLLTFPHALMRETAYRHHPELTRVLLHKRVADYLMEGRPDKVLVTHHLWQAGEAQAAGYALELARDAFSGSRFSEGEHYCEIALANGSEKERGTAAIKLARHWVRIGQSGDVDRIAGHLRVMNTPEAELMADLLIFGAALRAASATLPDLLEQTASIAARLPHLDTTLLSPALGMLIDVAHDGINATLCSQMIAIYRAEVAKSTDEGARVHVAALQVLWEALTSGFTPAIRMMSQLGDLTQQVNPSIKSYDAFVRGTVLLLGGQVRAAETHLSRSLQWAEEANDVRRRFAAQINWGIVCIEGDRFAEANKLLEGVMAGPFIDLKLRAQTNVAIMHYESGSTETALSTAKAVLRSNASYGSPKFRLVALAICGLIALDNREHSLAAEYHRAIVREWDRKAALFGDVGYTTTFLARMAAQTGDTVEATQLLSGSIDEVRPVNMLTRLRLELCTVDLLRSGNRHGEAIKMARQVRDQAVALGADLLLRRARVLCAVCRQQYPLS